MRLRSHVLNVTAAVLAVAFTIWWFVPGALGAVFNWEPSATAMRKLQGMVVDEAGAPVAGVLIVRIESDKVTALAQSVWDGRFAVANDHGERASHTELFFCHERFDVVHEWLPWDGGELRVVLRPRVPIEVRVVDENGEPVRVARSRCRKHPALDVPGATAWLDGDGNVLRGDAFRGTNYLSVAFADTNTVAHEPIGWRAIHVSEPGPVHLTVVAQTMQTCRVRVVAPDGTPVAYACVELIDARDGAVTAYQATVDDGDGPVGVDMQAADALGSARLLGPVGRSLVVRATSSGFAPGLADVRMPGVGTVVVRLGRLASGRGRVLAEPWLAARIAAGGYRLLIHEQDPLARRASCLVPLEDDGSFALDGAPPLACDVEIVPKAEAEPRSDGGRRRDHGQSLDLKEGDNSPLVIDMRECAWTDVSLRVRVNGDFPFCASFDSATSGAFRARAWCGADGRCSTRVRPDTYVVSVSASFGRRGSGEACAVLTVAGDRVDRELDLGIGEMVVSLVDAKGGPLRGLLCSADSTLAPARPTEWTNADGDGVLRKPCSAGEWSVSVGPHPRRLLGTVTVRGGEKTTATFVVPDEVPR